MTARLKKNVAGYVDEQGRFRPIRSPEYIGSRKATAKDRRKYSKVLGGDLGEEKQKAALAEKWEDPWDKEARIEREEKERIEREIAGDIYGDQGTRGKGRSLVQFVRAQGGIKRQFRFGGKKAFGKRSEYDKGEIDRLSYKETGLRGLTSETRGKTLDKMYQAAVQEGYDVDSINDLLSRLEDEAAGRGTTYATRGSMAYNPRTKAKGEGRRVNPSSRTSKTSATSRTKKNPDAVTTFAQLASGLVSAVQLNEMLNKPKKRVRSRRKAVAGRRKNPASATSRTSKTSQTRTANPRKKVAVPAKGRFYLMTVAKGDDLLGVFINDRDGDGITKKFKTVAAAKAFATKNRLALENPVAAPRKVALNFAPKWVKDLVGGSRQTVAGRRANPVVSKRQSVASRKTNPVRKPARSKGSVANPRKTASIKATPTAAKTNPRKVRLPAGFKWEKVPSTVLGKQNFHILDPGGLIVGWGTTRTSALKTFKTYAKKIRAGQGMSKERAKTIREGSKSLAFTVRNPTAAKRKANPAALRRGTVIVNKRHPEWGSFVVLDKYDDGIWEIRGRAGDRVLNEDEFKRFWKKQSVAKKRNPTAEKRKSNPTPKANGLVSRALARRKAGKYYRKELSLKRQMEKAREMREKYEQDAKNNPTAKTSKTVATSKTSRTRPNPAAVPRRRTFEMFNGRPATKSKVVPCSKLLGSGARVDQLGKLHEIHMESGEILKLNPAKFSLVAKGGRLWIVGGKFHSGPKVDRKINPWGKIKNIVYSTHKPHHGDRPGQHYIHEMGEWSGNRPTLSLDNEGFPVIQGGSYKIEARGIVD